MKQSGNGIPLDRMRILFTRFPLVSAQHGGAENQTLWLAEGLRAEGHTVSLLSSCPALLQAFHDAGFETYACDIGPPPVTVWHAVSFLWRRFSMRRMLEKCLRTLPKQDAVCMLSLSEKILLTEPLMRHGVRILWIEHDPVGRWLRKNPWLPLLKRASHFATIVCVSKLSATIYRTLGFPHVQVIVNGVPAPKDSVKIPPLPPREGPGVRASRDVNAPDDGPEVRARGGGTQEKNAATMRRLHVGCIARLSREKGIDVLLQAIAPLQDVELTIIGKGPEESALQHYIHRHQTHEHHARIRHLRYVETLDTAYTTMDVVVLPSRTHDPFGLVAAEAMMRGIPVIVTDACGIAASLTDGVDAYIVPAGDAYALRHALERLRRPTLRASIAQSGAMKAREVFSLATMIRAYSALLSTPFSPSRSAMR